MLRKVISGGRTGVEIAGLRAAQGVGLETGGWLPNGCRTEDGMHPEYVALYGMQETPTALFTERVAANVRDADVTLLIGANLTSMGARATKIALLRARKPYLGVQLLPGNAERSLIENHDRIVAALLDSRPEVLNVAGNSDPNLESDVENGLAKVFQEILRRTGPTEWWILPGELDADDDGTWGMTVWMREVPAGIRPELGPFDVRPSRWDGPFCSEADARIVIALYPLEYGGYPIASVRTRTIHGAWLTETWPTSLEPRPPSCPEPVEPQ